MSGHDAEVVGIDDGRCVGDSVGVSVSGHDGEMVGIEDGGSMEDVWAIGLESLLVSK